MSRAFGILVILSLTFYVVNANEKLKSDNVLHTSSKTKAKSEELTMFDNIRISRKRRDTSIGIKSESDTENDSFSRPIRNINSDEDDSTVTTTAVPLEISFTTSYDDSMRTTDSLLKDDPTDIELQETGSYITSDKTTFEKIDNLSNRSDTAAVELVLESKSQETIGDIDSSGSIASEAANTDSYTISPDVTENVRSKEIEWVTLVEETVTESLISTDDVGMSNMKSSMEMIKTQSEMPVPIEEGDNFDPKVKENSKDSSEKNPVDNENVSLADENTSTTTNKNSENTPLEKIMETEKFENTPTEKLIEPENPESTPLETRSLEETSSDKTIDSEKSETIEPENSKTTPLEKTTETESLENGSLEKAIGTENSNVNANIDNSPETIIPDKSIVNNEMSNSDAILDTTTIQIIDIKAFTQQPIALDSSSNTETVEKNIVPDQSISTSTLKQSDENTISETTTIPSDSSIDYNFVVYDESKIPCILASMSVALNISYDTKDSKTVSKEIKIPDGAITRGSCTSENSYMTVAWMSDPTGENSITFQFVKDGSYFYVSNLQARVILDEKEFPNASNVIVTGDSTENLRLFSASIEDGIHVCSTVTEVPCGKIVALIKDVSLIAYNDKLDISHRKEEQCTKQKGLNLAAIVGGLAGVIISVCIIASYVWYRKRANTFRSELP